MAEQKIVVLGTGGTIAGTAESSSAHLGYAAAQLGVADLVSAVAAAPAELVVEQVAQIDSKDMEPAVWQALAARCVYWLADASVAAIVITHGTDTMEETAYLLHRVLQADKPVVLTGAMRPATSSGADGPDNLRDAFAVALAPGARGVTVVFAGEIHAGVDVVKRHPYRLNAFDSGDAGAIGYVEDGAVRLVKPWPQAGVGTASDFACLAAATAWPRVEIVTNHAGGCARLVDLLVEDGVHGIVAAGTGNGTLHHALESALLRAQAAGVRVLRTTRCAQGRVIAHNGDRLPASEGLSPVKARIALMLAKIVA